MSSEITFPYGSKVAVGFIGGDKGLLNPMDCKAIPPTVNTHLGTPFQPLFQVLSIGAPVTAPRVLDMEYRYGVP